MVKDKIEFRKFWKTYDEIDALKDVSYTVHENDFFVLFGPSGAGKTTSLKAIAGLEFGSSGELFLNGEPANLISPQKRNIRMAFENYSLYPHLTVFQNLSSPLVVKGLGKEEVDNRVRDIARTLGIDEYLNRLPRELSGGQKQRVSLGRALIVEADIYLLDEPLAHLDAKIRNELRAEFQNIKSFLSNSTVVYVTHDYLEALSLGDRIGVINNGEIIQIDEPVKIYNEPENVFVAQLFGQPEINLFDCELIKENGTMVLKAEGINVNVPDSYLPSIQNIDHESVVLGCRPQHWKFSLTKPKGDGYTKGNVQAYEVRNYKGVILCRVGSMEITILCESYEDIDENTTIWIAPDPDHLYFFDIESGSNLINNKETGR